MSWTVHGTHRPVEALLRSLSASSPTGIFLTDVSGRWTFANDRCLTICDLPFESALGMGWLENVWPDDRERVAEAWAMLPQKEEIDIECRFGDPRHEPLWARIRAAPLLESVGLLVGYSGTVEDLQGLRETVEALRASEERFQAQYRGIPLPTYTWRWESNDFVLIDYNDAAVDYTGGTIREHLGERLQSFLAHEPDVVADFHRCFTERRSIRREFRHEMATTGAMRDMVTYYAFVPPDIVMVHTEDISGRRQVERAHDSLLAAEQQARARAESVEHTLAAIIERVPLGIVVVDAEGAVVLINEAGRAIAGPVSATIPLSQQSDAFVLRDRGGLETVAPSDTPIARMLVGETIEREDVLFRRQSDGSEVWCRVAGVPLADSEGHVNGAVAVFEDITRERLVEQEKDSFLSAAAHDLKSPLTTIRGFAQLLERRLRKKGVLHSEDAQVYLDRIVDTASHMSDLVAEMLDLTTIRMGEVLSLSLADADLVHIVRAAIDASVSPDDKERVHFHPAVEVLSGVWDEQRLRRAVGNLVSNAVTYSPNGEDVEIVVRPTGEGMAEISVADQGIGIPLSELSRIFNRFYRGSNAAGQFEGTGIGLSGVRYIVEQHGGTIEVASVEGEGSTFTVRLPLLPPAAGMEA